MNHLGHTVNCFNS